MWWDFRIRDSLLPVKLPSPCFLLQQQQQEDFKRQLNKYKNLFGTDWISFNSMSPQAAAVRCCCLSLVPVTAEHLHLFLRSSYETSCLLADIRASLSHYKEIFIPVPRANASSNFLIIWDFHASSCDLAGPINKPLLGKWSLGPSGASSFSEESDTNFSQNQRVPLFPTAPPGKTLLAG